MHLRSLKLGFAVASLLALTAGQALALVPPGTPATEFVKSRFAVVTETLADREEVRQGEKFTLAVRFEPYKTTDYEYHLYGIEDTPNMDYVKPLFQMVDAPGIVWSVEFPAGERKDGGKNRDGGYKGDMFILHGQQVIMIHGMVAPDAELGSREFTAKFWFNTCTEEFCLEPSTLEFRWPLEVVAADHATVIPVVPQEQLKVRVPIDPERFSLPTATQLEEADPDPPAPPEAKTATVVGEFKPRSGGGGDIPLSKALLLAFLGGLMLNFMPCVLPVVSIKVISLARHAQDAHSEVVKQGLVFCAGIIATFLALALVVNIIQAGGTQLGWGFQFQNPIFLIVMSTIIFAFGLSLAGVYTIKAPNLVTNEAEQLSEKEGYSGAFFKGVLATVLGTPCVGPFLGPALGYAFTQSAGAVWGISGAVWGIFGMVGLGMALPYALLVSNPRFLGMGQRERGKLTRGIMDAKGWLVDFERVMAFVLFATVLYLLNILGGSLGSQAVIWAMVFLLSVAFALWLWGRLVSVRKRGAVFVGLVLGPALIIGAGMLALPRIQPLAVSATEHLLAWEDYDRDQLMAHLSEGRTVLVDFTADWCPNCKTNEAIALNTPETKALVESLEVVTMIADWTTSDKE
ncbi:MAG: thioredoxin family protein, partial [bacterium]|nr:thioredoxin family protein [bacterium]